MKDAEVVTLAAAFLEEAASLGGDFINRPAYKALQAALRPIRVAAPPPDAPAGGFIPAALGGTPEPELTSVDHLKNVAEVSFEKDGSKVEKNLFSN